MNTPFLEAKEITKQYDSVSVLNHASLTLYEGEILGIVGKNASAKSTFLKILTGIVPADYGSFYIKGNPVRIKSPMDARKLGIFTFYDDYVPLIKDFSVADNLFLGNYTLSKPAFGLYHKKLLIAQAQQLLDQYEIPLDARQSLSTLSLGQQQIVFLLHAISQGCRLLIIDNCFSALDANEIALLSKLLSSLKNQNIAAILTSQNLTSLEKAADSLVILENGHFSEKVSQQKKKESLSAYRASLLPYPKLTSHLGKTFFQCINLCYQNRLKDISFSIREGEILGILGNSNSGRTTLSRVLCGDLSADVGKIYLHNQEIHLKSPSDAYRHKIALIQDTASSNALIPYQNAAFNITLNHSGKPAAGRVLTHHSHLSKTSSRLIEKLGIKCLFPKQPAKQLSAGNRQKLAFARAIYSDAKLYLLDEPTKGIDNAGRIQIDSLINELARKGNSLILFSSDIEEAISICDRILILHDGRITGELQREEFSRQLLEEKVT